MHRAHDETSVLTSYSKYCALADWLRDQLDSRTRYGICAKLDLKPIHLNHFDVFSSDELVSGRKLESPGTKMRVLVRRPERGINIP